MNIPYILKLSERARRLRLAVHGDGNVIVTAPRNVRRTFIESFILQKTRWILKTLGMIQKLPKRIPLASGRGDYLKYKPQALTLAHERIVFFNTLYGFRFNRISIKNQKTRWGSCSRKGNINFNYKIALLPEKFADYIIVHELCHLGAFNHSRAFWDLVARAIPDHKAIRKTLNRSYRP